MMINTTSTIPYIYHHKLSSTTSNDDKETNYDQIDKKYVSIMNIN